MTLPFPQNSLSNTLLCPGIFFSLPTQEFFRGQGKIKVGTETRTHANVNVVKINRDNWMVREKKYLPKLCHIRKKSFGRLSKALLSILESSCYGSKKLSELPFFLNDT